MTDSASELLRSSAPLANFEKGLQLSATLTGRVSSRRPLFWMYPATPSVLGTEGAVITIRLATITDGGEGIEDVTMRLERRRVWRVAGYAPAARVPEDRRNLLLPQDQPLAPGVLQDSVWL